MKKFFLILFFSSFVSVFSQNTSIDKNYEKESEITLLKKIEKLEKEVELLKKDKTFDGKIIEYSNNVISNQNATIGSFSFIYTTLTILITIITIALPILTYFFGIKPAQKIKKKIEEEFDKKINNYLTNYRDLQINQAIENLRTENKDEIKSLSLSYLMLTYTEGFNDDQKLKLKDLYHHYELSDILKLNLKVLLEALN